MMRGIGLLTVVIIAAPLWADETSPLPPSSPLAPPAATATPATPAELPAATPPPEPAPPPAATAARPASAKPLPEVPVIADEPMPIWKRPPPTPAENRRAIFLSLAPEVQLAQRLRQTGMGIAIAGCASILVGSVFYDQLSSNNLHNGFTAGGGNTGMQQAGIGLMVGGSALAIVGASIFTVGQLRLRAWHEKRPHDTLPSLSGF